jgi:hypothetical protein
VEPSNWNLDHLEYLKSGISLKGAFLIIPYLLSFQDFETEPCDGTWKNRISGDPIFSCNDFFQKSEFWMDSA